MKTKAKRRSTEREDSESNFKVVVRVRPPLDRELADDRFISTVRLIPLLTALRSKWKKISDK